MSGDFMDGFMSARTFSNSNEMLDLLRGIDRAVRDIRDNMVSIEKYNDLMMDRNKIVEHYNCDTANFEAQRDEAVEIFRENQEVLPFTPEEARARMRAKGFEAEAEERRIRGYEPDDSDEATKKPS